MGSAVLDQVASLRAEEVAQQRSTFRALVSDIATGALSGSDAATVNSRLVQTGRTLAELGAAVIAFKERAELAAELSALPERQRALQGVQARISAENEQLASATKEHRAATEPLHNQRASIERGIVSSRDARNRLISTCPWPEIQERETELRARRKKLGDEQRRIKASLGTEPNTPGAFCNIHLANDIRRLEESGANPKTVQHRKDDRERYRVQKIAPLEAQLADVNRQLAAVDAEESALEEAKCQP